MVFLSDVTGAKPTTPRGDLIRSFDMENVMGPYHTVGYGVFCSPSQEKDVERESLGVASRPSGYPKPYPS